VFFFISSRVEVIFYFPNNWRRLPVAKKLRLLEHPKNIRIYQKISEKILLGSSLLCPHTRDPPLGSRSSLAEFFQHTYLQNNLQTSPTSPLESYPGAQPQKWNTVCYFGFFLGNLIFIGILQLLLLRSPRNNINPLTTPHGVWGTTVRRTTRSGKKFR